MQVKAKANYGVLAHEKHPVFTIGAEHPHATCSEEVIISIPDEFTPCLSEGGDILVTVEGRTHLLREVLNNNGDEPCISWYDGVDMRTKNLTWSKA